MVAPDTSAVFEAQHEALAIVSVTLYKRGNGGIEVLGVVPNLAGLEGVNDIVSDVEGRHNDSSRGKCTLT